MAKSKIEWTEETWNPLAGCLKVSPGCENCYAIKQAFRNAKMKQTKYHGTVKKMANGDLNWTGKINLDPLSLRKPLIRKKPTMYFVNSMSDLFHKDVPFWFIDDVFSIIKQCPQHIFQILTKRPQQMHEYFASTNSRLMDEVDLFGNITVNNPFPNVWLGVSAEDQKTADERIPILLQIPAAVRWVSAEPLISEITIQHLRDDLPWHDINWVVVGGESGHKARECQLEWMHKIVHDCKAADVPVFVKQLGTVLSKKYKLSDSKGGDINEFPTNLQIREYPV